ncbi:hypothetical protein GSI_11991 [Ganoderma sinense ZZ0214-1]|uniref:Uncharacterized protein n=1 Tax=Ganoderma sinense ZZ0214-1 TaxID=1077348 RepID=A0A2G8RXJ5_9APHY|nr:hypothetical protein GSI_11991 [Ganoderma sinense ZZ0214-1]
MDILSLSRWRSTCRVNYAQGTSSLQRTLTDHLRAFVPSVHQLVDIVTAHGGVFGGEIALSFILRDDPYRPPTLEIYSSYSTHAKLCKSILENPSIRTHIENYAFSNNTLFRSVHRHIVSSLVVHLTNGRSIIVHQSYTSSPSAPISRAPCTALSNFVTPYSFGCSHPALTFARRALLADKELAIFSPFDFEALDRLLARNFSIAVSPSAWPEYRRIFEDGLLWSPEECRRDRFVCPNQGRFFGDKGSMVGYFDPLGADEERCMKNNVAPFGPMVIWRMMTTFECDDGCDYLDEALDHGVASIPVLFRKDEFGELRDCISDGRTRTSPLYRYLKRGRSFSV